MSGDQQQLRAESARYDAKTVKEAIALAGRLQDEHRSMMSVDQIEAVASEVGVDPAFVSQALARLEKSSPALSQPPVTPVPLRKRQTASTSRIPSKLPALWWAVGWTAPAFAGVLNAGDSVAGVCALGWIAGGIALSILTKPPKEEENEERIRAELAARTRITEKTTENVSREELLATLFALQKQLEQGKKTRAFLSIDVVGSAQMKRESSELASEYSFGQYRRWLEERVRAEGGLLHSAAGDGTMCVFESEETAVRVAQMLLEDLPRFNREQNHLNQPFQIRCGISEGEIAVEPGAPIGAWQSSVIDRAAVLQKEAAPNTVLVGSRTSGM